MFVGLISAISLSGCLGLAWSGYKTPLTNDFHCVGNQTIQLTIGRQNLSDHQWRAIEEAATCVCVIFASEEFRQSVISRSWLANCSRTNGHGDIISGQVLYDMMMHGAIKYSIYPHRPWRAEGQAENGKTELSNRIAVSPDIIEGWFSPSDSIQAALINVLAHESIHILSEDFLDYDGRPLCQDSLLVSYGIGDLTERLWLKHIKE